MRMTAYNNVNTQVGEKLNIFPLIIGNIVAVFRSPMWEYDNNIAVCSCFLNIPCNLVLVKKIYAPGLVTWKWYAVSAVGVVCLLYTSDAADEG